MSFMVNSLLPFCTKKGRQSKTAAPKLNRTSQIESKLSVIEWNPDHSATNPIGGVGGVVSAGVYATGAQGSLSPAVL